MTSSLHVSLPDEMRKFVDHRTDGTHHFSTPSEYVRALIRDDMEKQAQRLYVHKELLRSTADIMAGRLHSAAAVKNRSDRVLQDLRADTRE